MKMFKKRETSSSSPTGDMRQYLQTHLDLYGLGRLVTIKGPERGGSQRDQAWYQMTIVYRPEGVTNHLDDVYISNIFLGYSRTGGYWNRRHIRVAIEKHARERHMATLYEERKTREREEIDRVWKSARLAITDGK